MGRYHRSCLPFEFLLQLPFHMFVICNIHGSRTTSPDLGNQLVVISGHAPIQPVFALLVIRKGS